MSYFTVQGSSRRSGSGSFAGYGADAEVTEPGGKICRVAERRIRPIIEATPNLLLPVPPRFTTGGRPGVRLHHACFGAFTRLKQAAETDGIPPNILTISSGYRSVALQKTLWERGLVKHGSAQAARKWVAPPGGSPHHTGRAIDFYMGHPAGKEHVPALRRTAAYRWMVCNAERFGFTPYAVEPWHWEFNPPGLDASVPPRHAPAPMPEAPPPAAPPHRPRSSRRGGEPRTQPPPPAPSSAPRAPGAPAPAAPPHRPRRPSQAPAPAPSSAPPGPGGDPLASFSLSERKALNLTSHFEGGRRLRFESLTGNFDAQGISFGLLQWNFGSGSLTKLLKRFVSTFPARFDAVFGDGAAELRQVLESPPPRPLEWARSVNDSTNHVVDPWAGRFRDLGADPEFRNIQLAAVRDSMNAAVDYTLRFHFQSERALALMFDAVTSGPCWLFIKDRRRIIADRMAARQRELGGPLSERQTLGIIADVLADTALERWRSDVRKRKQTIVNGTGVVHGDHIDLERQFGITDRPHDGTIVPPHMPGFMEQRCIQRPRRRPAKVHKP